jgi:hypothetical protein
VLKTAALVLVVLVLVVAVAVAALRWRKLRHDQHAHHVMNDAPITAPPAPYASNRGVRLLDAGDVPHTRSEPARPRLDPERQYVFSDTSALEPSSLSMTRSKHNERWALERSFHGPRVASGSGRVIVIVVLALSLLIGIGAILQHSNHPATPTTTTTTSRH